MIWKITFVTFVVVGVLPRYTFASPPLRRMKRSNSFEEDVKAEDKEAILGILKNGVECLDSLFKLDTLQKDIEDAKENGNLDKFLKENCAKSPQMKMCLDTMTADITPYLDDTLRQELAYLSKSNNQIMDYFCDSEGASIASFLSKGGPDCHKEMSPIQICAKKFKQNVSNLEDIVGLALKNQCAMFDIMSACVVQSLKECPTMSNADYAESFFKNIKNKNQCN